jgi:ComF family protein
VVLPQGCWAGGTGEVALGLSAEMRERIAALAAQRFCHYCGLTVGPHEAHDKQNPCGRCGQREVGVDRIARVGTFNEPLVTLVHRLKFGRSWEVAAVLAPFVYQAILRVAEETQTPVDLLIPVPLHWSRRARRGFNQAEEIVLEILAITKWRAAKVLWRTRRTAEQALTDSVTARRENLRGAFACRRYAGKQVAGKHVWLVDDVSTTGATLHAAAGALRLLPRAQRPASISAAVVCVTDHQAPEPALA